MSLHLPSTVPGHQRVDLWPSGLAQAGLVIGTGVLALGLAAAAALTDLRSIALLLILAPALALAAVRLPGATFAAFLYIPFYKGALDPITPIDITPVLATLCFLLSLPLFVSGRFRLPRAGLALWGSILLLIVVGALYAPDRQRAVELAVTFLSLVFLPSLLGLRVAQDTRLQQQFLWFTIVLSLLVTIVGVAQLGTLGAQERLTVFGTSTIGVGRAAMLLPLLAVAVRTPTPQRVRYLLWALAPVSILVAFSSGSRGPLLTGIASILIVTLFNRRHLGKRIAGGLAVVVGGFVAIQSPAIQGLVPSASLERMQGALALILPTGSDSGPDTSTATRFELFGIAARMFEQRPVLGFGTGSFEWIASARPGFTDHAYPHNLFLQFAAEYGIIGLGIIIAMLGYVLIQTLDGIHRGHTMAFAMLAMFAFLNALVSSGLIDNRWLWGSLVVLLGLTAQRSPATPAHHRDGLRQTKGGRAHGA